MNLPQRAKLLGFLLTPLSLALVILTLCIWHPLISLSRFINLSLHQSIIELGNFLLIFHLRVVGARVKTVWAEDVPPTGPVILIANHQSFFDIPLFIWHLRRYHPRFVAKKSLRHGIPSVSLVLRTGGSALIDRSNAKQALPQIAALGRLIIERECGACIFPEGTRARDGVLKPFKAAGAKALLQASPGVPVVPVAIDGAWKLMRFNWWPIPYGTQITLTVLDQIKRDDLSDDEVIARCEQAVHSHLTLSAL